MANEIDAIAKRLAFADACLAAARESGLLRKARRASARRKAKASKRTPRAAKAAKRNPLANVPTE